MSLFATVDRENSWPRIALMGAAILLLPIPGGLLLDIAPKAAFGPGAVVGRCAGLFGPCAVGLLLSSLHPTTIRHARLLYCVWILPFFVLVGGHIWHDGIPQRQLLNQEFGLDLSGDEGFTMLLITFPMLGAVSYTVARIGIWDRFQRRSTSEQR